MIRFSIWSLIPKPCRPPIAFAWRTRSTALSKACPSMAIGRPCSNVMVTFSAAISTAGSQNRTPMIGSTISMPTSRFSSSFASWVAPQMLASVE